MGFAKQWTGVTGYMIRKPGFFFENYDEEHGLRYPLLYMLLSIVVSLVPAAILVVALTLPSLGGAVAGVVTVVVLALLFWVLGVFEAVVAHVIATAFGARGAATSLEAYAFPTIVRYGLWWLPLVNVGLFCYGLYLQIKGLSTFHGISTGKAAVAVLVPLVLYLPLLVVVVAVVGAFVLDLGSTGATGTPPQAFLGWI